MSALTTDQIIALLTEYVRQSGEPLDLILIGGLALQAYGATERSTRDLDAELTGNLTSLAAFLTAHQIPADLSENISGWAVVAMPPGYRVRATALFESSGLRVRLLDPVDFIIAKLRRGTELDLDDARFVAGRFCVSGASVRNAAEAALAASPKDTALFAFQQIVTQFCDKLTSSPGP